MPGESYTGVVDKYYLDIGSIVQINTVEELIVQKPVPDEVELDVIEESVFEESTEVTHEINPNEKDTTSSEVVEESLPKIAEDEKSISSKKSKK